MSARRGLGARGMAILAGIITLLAGWIYVSRRATDAPPAATTEGGILQFIPPGAMLVATVDVAALRHTPLGEQLLGQGRSVAGLGEVATICGADPMDQVEGMAIAIPDAGQDTGFGLFASGPIRAAELIGCAEKIVAKRGGRPVRVAAGSFTVLKDASLELSSAELAAAEGGPVILAEPTYVRAALGTVAAESIQRDERHAALRELVPAGQLVATAVLSAEQRRALIEELEAQNQSSSPFRAVTGGALTLTVDEALELVVAIRCDDTRACTKVAAHIQRAAEDEAESEAAQAIGLSAVLKGLQVQTEGDAVRIRVHMPAADALVVLRRALAFRKLLQSGGLVEPPPRAEGAPAPPREDAPDAGVGDAGLRIPAKPDAGFPPAP